MIFDNMVNDNDLSSLRKDKQYQALLAAVKDRQPLSVLKKSAPYGRDAMKMENPSKALVVIDIQDDITKHYRDIVDNINAAVEWAVSEDMLRATPLHQTSRWAIENVAMLSISVMGSVWDKSQA